MDTVEEALAHELTDAEHAGRATGATCGPTSSVAPTPCAPASSGTSPTRSPTR
jgi:hypothetical protein